MLDISVPSSLSIKICWNTQVLLLGFTYILNATAMNYFPRPKYEEIFSGNNLFLYKN